jgi:hypothetical protein
LKEKREALVALRSELGGVTALLGQEDRYVNSNIYLFIYIYTYIYIYIRTYIYIYIYILLEQGIVYISRINFIYCFLHTSSSYK